MLMCAQTHGFAYTQPHTPTHSYVYTPTYARIRAREGIFLTSNLLYSIVKPSSIISPTPFTYIIQSLYNPYLYWHLHRCVICTNHHHLPLIYHSLATISQPFLSLISQFISHHHLITIHHLARIIQFYPISIIINHSHPIKPHLYVSLLYNSLYICRVPIYFLIYATFSYTQITYSSIYWLHY